MSVWGVWKSRIVVVGLDEYFDVIHGVTSSDQNICIRCICVNKIIGIRILDILSGFFKFELLCFRCI